MQTTQPGIRFSASPAPRCRRSARVLRCPCRPLPARLRQAGGTRGAVNAASRGSEIATDGTRMKHGCERELITYAGPCGAIRRETSETSQPTSKGRARADHGQPRKGDSECPERSVADKLARRTRITQTRARPPCRPAPPPARPAREHAQREHAQQQAERKAGDRQGRYRPQSLVGSIAACAPDADARSAPRRTRPSASGSAKQVLGAGRRLAPGNVEVVDQRPRPTRSASWRGSRPEWPPASARPGPCCAESDRR